MMKNLLIIGQPRTGKTTLANMIAKRLGYSIVSIDAMVATFRNVFPELGLHFEPEKSEPILAPFLFEYINQIATASPKQKFVVEGCHISPATAARGLNNSGYNIVCLGIPTMTPHRFLESVKQNGSDKDWAATKPGAEILEMAQYFITRSKQQQTECAELGVPFIDTSLNRDVLFMEFIESMK